MRSPDAAPPGDSQPRRTSAGENPGHRVGIAYWDRVSGNGSRADGARQPAPDTRQEDLAELRQNDHFATIRLTRLYTDRFTEARQTGDWLAAGDSLGQLLAPDAQRLAASTPNKVLAKISESFRDQGLRGPQAVHERLQAETADELAGMVGQQAIWDISQPGTTFYDWAVAPEETGLVIGPESRLNCWEMISGAAYLRGTLPWRFFHDLYSSIPEAPGIPQWERAFAEALMPGGNTTHFYRDPIPRGHIVTFEGINHVGLGTGNTDKRGVPTAYNFWAPWPARYGDRGAVQITAVDVLGVQALRTGNPNDRPIIKSGAGPW